MFVISTCLKNTDDSAIQIEPYANGWNLIYQGTNLGRIITGADNCLLWTSFNLCEQQKILKNREMLKIIAQKINDNLIPKDMKFCVVTNAGIGSLFSIEELEYAGFCQLYSNIYVFTNDRR